MSKYRKQSDVIYKCDYHIVWVPKYRFRILKGAIKELVENDIRHTSSTESYLENDLEGLQEEVQQYHPLG